MNAMMTLIYEFSLSSSNSPYIAPISRQCYFTLKPSQVFFCALPIYCLPESRKLSVSPDKIFELHTEISNSSGA